MHRINPRRELQLYPGPDAGMGTVKGTSRGVRMGGTELRKRFGMDEAAMVLLCRLLCVLVCVSFWLGVYKLMARAFF